MAGAKIHVDMFRIMKEIRKLAVLRQPMFEVYIKTADKLKEWNFDDAQAIRAPDIQGHRIPVSLDGGRITGEIIIARRPLSEEERGIAVMVGNHIVTRSNFGFDTKLNRVTGFVRCDALTTRFADKSAIIEDDESTKFNQQMKTFVIDTVIPGLTEYEDVLITREESKIYREIDKVLGLKLGADDYVTKPFSFMELMARVEAVLRRAGAGGGKIEAYTFGDVSVNFRTQEARRKGRPIDLSQREFRLLKYFIEKRGQVVAREELLEAVWGYQNIPFTRTVDMHVAKLRKKIEWHPDEPEFIVTVHRAGYKFTG